MIFFSKTEISRWTEDAKVNQFLYKTRGIVITMNLSWWHSFLLFNSCEVDWTWAALGGKVEIEKFKRFFFHFGSLAKCGAKNLSKYLSTINSISAHQSKEKQTANNRRTNWLQKNYFFKFPSQWTLFFWGFHMFGGILVQEEHKSASWPSREKAEGEPAKLMKLRRKKQRSQLLIHLTYNSS